MFRFISDLLYHSNFILKTIDRKFFLVIFLETLYSYYINYVLYINTAKHIELISIFSTRSMKTHTFLTYFFLVCNFSRECPINNVENTRKCATENRAQYAVPEVRDQDRRNISEILPYTY